MEKPKFDTKIAIVLRDDLLSWQKLNVTAFLASTISSHFPETIGKDFIDSSNVGYLGMFRQPVMIFQSNAESLKKLYKKAREGGLSVGIYTKKLFETQGDQNLEAIAMFKENEQDYVGLSFYGNKNQVDKVLDGQKLHP